jgi:hypothetical protein
MAAAPRHPSRCTTRELADMLRAEDLGTVQRLLAVKCEQRTLAAERDELERRLREMDRWPTCWPLAS